MSSATSSPNALLADKTWRRRNSRWLWWCYLGFGMLGFVGFFIIAMRVGGKKWWRRAAIVGALHIPSWVLMGLFNDGEGRSSSTTEGIKWGSGSSGTIVPADFAIILWICVIIYGLIVNREYLRWRSDNANEWYNQPVGGQAANFVCAPPPVQPSAPQAAPFLGVDTSAFYANAPAPPPPVAPTWPPPAPTPTAATPQPPTTAQIDINAASAGDIAMALGIDDATVRRVVEARIQNGGFAGMDDLATRAGLQPHEMLRFRDKVRFGPAQAGPAATPTPTQQPKPPSDQGTGRILDY